jgi:DNA-directed RNA polymerase subunit RPC12/RpoP
LQLNIFDCRHKRITRPITPVAKTTAAEPATYVVCLDCGRQFAYDLKTMRVGARVPASPATGVLDSDAPRRKNALRYAVIASIAPLVWAGSRFFRKAPPTAAKE